MTEANVAPITSIVMHRRLALVLGALLLDIAQVLIEHDAAFAGERDEALAAGATDEREVGLARGRDRPGGGAGAGGQDGGGGGGGRGHHLRGEPAGGVEDLVGGGN